MKQHSKALNAAVFNSLNAVQTFTRTREQLVIQNEEIEKQLLAIEADIDHLQQLKNDFVNQHSDNQMVLRSIDQILKGGAN